MIAPLLQRRHTAPDTRPRPSVARAHTLRIGLTAVAIAGVFARAATPGVPAGVDWALLATVLLAASNSRAWLLVPLGGLVAVQWGPDPSWVHFAVDLGVLLALLGILRRLRAVGAPAECSLWRVPAAFGLVAGITYWLCSPPGASALLLADTPGVWLFDPWRAAAGVGVGLVCGLVLALAQLSTTVDRLRARTAELEHQQQLGEDIGGYGQWSLAPTLGVPVCSAQCSRIFGRTPNEPPPILDEQAGIYRGKHLERLRGAVQRAVSDGTSFSLELEICVDSETKWVRAVGVAERAAGPAGHCINGLVQDITAFKRVEQELRWQGQFQALLMQISARGIAVPHAEIDAALHRSLQEMAEFVGADRAYVFTYDFDHGTCTNTYEWCATGIEPQIDTLQAVPLSMLPDWVTTHRRGDPVVIPSVADLPPSGLREVLSPQGIKSLLAVPMMDQQTCIGFVGFDSVREPKRYSRGEQRLLEFFCHILVNIARRQRAEEAIHRSEERFRRLFDDVTTVSIQGCDASGQVLYWNAGACALYGYSPEEAIGRSIFELIVPENRSREFEDLFARFRNNDTLPNRELTLLRKGGSLVEVYSSRTIVAQPHGVSQLYCIDIDLTEIKLAERERENLQRQLDQAQRMESVGQLAGGVAHDFNNTLHVILGRAELGLAELSSDQRATRHLEQIRQAAHRSAALTQQLLGFARRQTVAPIVLDLNEAIESILKLLQLLVGRHIELQWMPGTTLERVRMDPAQVDQILTNLVVNARDAIVTSGRITIATRNDRGNPSSTLNGAPHSGYVLLTVGDTGSGIDPTTRPRIFEPFFTTKPSGHGTGLGLATVYGIVKQNGGFIEVHSAPGQGSTFEVWLPAYFGEPQAQPEPETSQLRAIGGSETILLVDDEPAVLELGQRTLETLGYRVLVAGSAVDALEIATRLGPEISLLVTDVTMPQTNGRELADTLKARLPDIKTLYMSGYTADVITNQGVLADGMHFVHKPFSIQVLADKVRAALAGD